MTPLNYNHLYYFYIVATEGSIAKASARINLTPQTISGQITSFESQINVNLFVRQGRKLQLSEMGQIIYSHAEEVFKLGDEIKLTLKNRQQLHWNTFTVGITDVIPKVLAYQLLAPVLNKTEGIRLICHEGSQEDLLADLAINKLDCILSDQPLQISNHIKAFNHQIASSGFTFFAAKQLANNCGTNFPQCLSEQPFLLQGKKSAVSWQLASWFEKYEIMPKIVAEFDDSALMKSFGQAGYGIFSGPSIIAEHIATEYGVEIIGKTEEITGHFYAISPERRIKHPAVVEIVKAAGG